MLDRADQVPVEGVHDVGSPAIVCVASTDHHSLLHYHSIHYLDQEQHAKPNKPLIYTSQKFVFIYTINGSSCFVFKLNNLKFEYFYESIQQYKIVNVNHV